MSRAVIVIDRIAILLVGLVLLAGGVYALGWWYGDVVDLPERLQSTTVESITEQRWWPLALGLSGIVLVIVGLRWLGAHIPNRATPTLRMSGSDSTGKLTVSSQAVADAAASEFKQTVGVDSVRARLIRDRGQTVLTMRGMISADADLSVVGRAADSLSSNVIQVTGRDDLRCRIQLGVRRKS